MEAVSGRIQSSTGASCSYVRPLAPRTIPRTRVVLPDRIVVRSSTKEVLRECASIGDDTYSRVNSLHSGLLDRTPEARLLPVLHHFLSLGLSSQELQMVLQRHPQVFTYPLEDVLDVTAFLQQDVHLSLEDLRTVVTRYPAVFSYSVKGHLRPQLAYLASLGVDDAAAAVRSRPLLLGEGIETVIKFLRICGVPRRQVASLIRSYPIDYCCRFIFSSVHTTPQDKGKGV